MFSFLATSCNSINEQVCPQTDGHLTELFLIYISGKALDLLNRSIAKSMQNNSQSLKIVPDLRQFSAQRFLNEEEA